MSASRDMLRELMAILGTAGIAVTERVPALLAMLDQHKAAVRDSVGDGWSVPGPVALAGYADGLIIAAAEVGWQLPGAGQLDWLRADWRVLRLLAVCDLAVQGRYV